MLEDVALGDSIAVNGVCLTVTDVQSDADGAGVWSTDVMGETLAPQQPRRARPRRRRSTSSARSPPHTRLGGHIVQGHVDGVGTVARRARPATHWEVVRIALPRRAGPLRRREGLDRRRRRLADRQRGQRVDDPSLVRGQPDPRPPCARPRWARSAPGDPVNLEVDVIAKYVERLLEGRA